MPRAEEREGGRRDFAAPLVEGLLEPRGAKGKTGARAAFRSLRSAASAAM